MSQNKNKAKAPDALVLGAEQEAAQAQKKVLFLTEQNTYLTKTVSSLKAENETLKEKIQAIVREITELMATLEFPTKITFWWALTNASKLFNFVKGIIDILKNKG